MADAVQIAKFVRQSAVLSLIEIRRRFQGNFETHRTVLQQLKVEDRRGEGRRVIVDVSDGEEKFQQTIRRLPFDQFHGQLALERRTDVFRAEIFPVQWTSQEQMTGRAIEIDEGVVISTRIEEPIDDRCARGEENRCQREFFVERDSNGLGVVDEAPEDRGEEREEDERGVHLETSESTDRRKETINEQMEQINLSMLNFFIHFDLRQGN